MNIMDLYRETQHDNGPHDSTATAILVAGERIGCALDKVANALVKVGELAHSHNEWLNERAQEAVDDRSGK